MKSSLRMNRFFATASTVSLLTLVTFVLTDSVSVQAQNATIALPATAASFQSNIPGDEASGVDRSQIMSGVSAGTGMFSFGGNYSGPYLGIRSDVGDVDGDGDLDIVVSHGFSVTEPNTVWLNDGSGAYVDSGQRLGNSFSEQLALGDVDGDGDLDLYVANRNGQANKVYFNQGGVQAGTPGTFVDSGQNLGSDSNNYVSLGDLDGDLDLDAFATSNGGSDRIWINDGSGFFSAGQALPAASATNVSLGDVDGDGDLDAMIAASGGATPVWTNDGTGNFTLSQNLPDSYGAAFGDVDGDGDLDALLALTSLDLQTYLNNGSGTFSLLAGSTVAVGGAATYLVMGDVDDDGDLDVLVPTFSAGSSKIFTNDGAGFYSDAAQPFSGGVRSAVFGDLDNDGDLDVAMTRDPQLITVWTNDNAPVLDECDDVGFDINQISLATHFANLIPAQGVGQSFTAPCNGWIRTIQVNVTTFDSPVLPIEGTLRVFEGQGGNGTEIGTEPYSITVQGVQTIALQDYVRVQVDQVYTFFLDAPTSGSGNLFGSSNGDPYTGGIWLVGPDPSSMVGLAGDLAFAIDFAPEIVVNSALDNQVPDDGLCTLREAIDNAQNTSFDPEEPGDCVGGYPNNRIVFDIPGPGPHVVTLDDGLPWIVEPLEIDGYTQPGAVPNSLPARDGSNAQIMIELDGSQASGTYSNTAFYVTGPAAIRGLAINGFPTAITASFFYSKTSGTSEFTPFDGTETLIEGNFIGTDASGSVAVGNDVGISIFSHGWPVRIGGTSPESANVIAGNTEHGIQISDSDDLVTVQGNYIGVGADGSTALPNDRGISISSASDVHVGGVDPGAGNVIAGNTSPGIEINSFSNDVVVEGNFIGTSGDGISPLPNQSGIIILDSSNNAIGGTAAGAGNVIAHNDLAGVLILQEEAAEGNAILGNSIFANGQLGIDLADLGEAGIVNANDAGDADGGSNRGMNYPVISAANFSGGQVNITGNLNTTPDEDVRIEFFGNESCDASGFGQGQSYLGFVDATAGPGGDLGFNVNFSVAGVDGQAITATATDEGQNTSEFSRCFEPPTIAVPDGYIFQILRTDLSGPSDVTVDASGNLYAIHVATGKVFRYAADGTAATELLNNLLAPSAIAISGPYLLVADPGRGGIYRFTLSTLGAGTNVTAAQPTPWLATSNGPAAMTPGPDGLLYYSETNQAVGERIRRVNPASASPTPTDVIVFATGLNRDVTGLAFDSVGDLYLATTQPGDVRRLATPSAASLPVTGSSLPVLFTGLTVPSSLDFRLDDNLFVGSDSRVLSGTLQSSILAPFVTGLGGGAEGISFDGKGRLYIVDENSGQLILVTAPKRQVLLDESITFTLNQDGNPRITDGSDLQAIRSAFATWNNVSDAVVTVSDNGTTAATQASATDGVNLITFKDTAFPFAPFVLAVAAKTIEFSSADEAAIVDADIVFNPVFVSDPKFPFGTSSKPGFFDIQSIATHEVGHTLGMIHSGYPEATMFFALPPGNEARSLSMDDRAWISYRYPNETFDDLGSISGRVEDGENPGAGVAGALVLASNTTTGEAVSAYADLNGDYLIPGLEDGTYKVSIQPLDGDVFGFPLSAAAISPNLANITRNTDFVNEFYNASESGDPSVDNPNAFQTFSIAGNDVTSINFITNRDETPPSVAAFSPAGGATNVDLNTDVLITFSETVVASSLNVTITEQALPGSPLAGTIQLENNGKLAIIALTQPLKPTTVYNVAVAAGLADKRGNATTTARSISFTTETADTSIPTVVEVSPGSGAAMVNTGATITALFSERMTPASITAPGAFTVANAGSPIQGIVTVDRALDNTVAVFDPVLPLSEGTTYTVTLTTNVKDASGNALASNFVTTFSTVASAPPEIVLAEPAAGRLDVGTQTTILLDFSESIDRGSVSPATFSLTGPSGAVPGTFQFLNEDSRVVFRPASSLAFNTTYNVMVTTGIADVSIPAENLQTAFNSSFKTAVAPVLPQIASVSPPSAVVGTVVVIAGTGFDPVAGNNQVNFAGATGPVAGTVTTATLTSITTRVPDGAISGPLTVGTSSGTSNAFPFDVVVIAPGTDDAVARVSAEGGSRDAEVTPDGAFAYVTNSGAGTVYVVDLDNPSGPQTTIPVGTSPFKIAINPDGTRAYVTNFGSHTVSVIDLDPGSATYNEVVDTIPVGLNPTGIAIAPDGSKIYVAEFTSKGVSIIEGDETRGGFNRVIARVSSESGNRDIETSPDGTIAFVASTTGIAVIDIDPASSTANNVIARVSRESSTRDVTVSPDGAFAFATTTQGEILWIAIQKGSPQPYQVIARTSKESGARETDVSPDGSQLYVTNFNNGTVDVYALGISTVGGSSFVAARTGSSSAEAQSSSDEPIIGVTFTLKKTNTIDVGDNPEGIVFDATGNRVVVANSSASTASTESLSIITFDADSDRDGISDIVEPTICNAEQTLCLDPFNPDTDGDGIVDGLDLFPLDPSESGDADGDGIGDNADPDDDNDLLLDTEEIVAESNPFNPDTDGDMVSDYVEVIVCQTNPLSNTDYPIRSLDGTVTSGGSGVAGVVVKLLDGRDPTVILEQLNSGAGGAFSFGDRKFIEYQVMVVEPTGYRIPDGDENPFVTTTTGCAFDPASPALDAFVLVNDARSSSYWKHQFDRIVKGKSADETQADLEAWIQRVRDRYTNPYYQTLFQEETNGEGDDLAEWHALLSGKLKKNDDDDSEDDDDDSEDDDSGKDSGTLKKKAKAEAEIAALVLNVMSLKVGQYEIVSQDGHDVGDVITYASQIVIDPAGTSPDLKLKEAYELAEKIAKDVNKQKTIKAGVLPDCSTAGLDCDRLYKGAGEVPEEFSLFQNYPNPFNPQTTVKYGIPEPVHVRIDVFDILGRHVLTLMDADQNAGLYELNFDASQLTSGLYMYRIEAGAFKEVRKMVLTK